MNRRSFFAALSITSWAIGAVAGCNIGGLPQDDLSMFVSFTDPDNPDFSTVDVLDVDEEIVRFDSETLSIVWQADGSSYQAGSWVVNGNLLGPTGFFQVRFGTKDGVRKAYFTETGPATICDISIQFGGLSIRATNVTVPQE